MPVIVGVPTTETIDDLLDALAEIRADTGSLVQVVDASRIVGEAHLERAAELALRAHERNEGIADDTSMECLLYAAGTRQIDQAMHLGISSVDTSAAIVVSGGGGAEAIDRVSALITDTEHPEPDQEWIREWYDITDAELAATEASLTDLVLERVVLLDVNK